MTSPFSREFPRRGSWRLAGLLPASCAALFLSASCNTPQGPAGNQTGAGAANRTAVYSHSDPTYTRSLRQDRSFTPETYVFKEGGYSGGPRRDRTQDQLTFDDISRVVGGTLATQNYLPSDDPPTTSLLIVVYWGTTVVPDDVVPHSARPSVTLSEQASTLIAQAKLGDAASGIEAKSLQGQAAANADSESIMDGRINAKNANLLGYTDEILRVSPRDPYLHTLQDELEHDRYYVVLLAYDYQLGRKTGQRKLLWETRYSIPETGSDFGACFPEMTAIAAQYFGQDSHGLIHHNLANTHIEVGEPTSLGPVPAK